MKHFLQGKETAWSANCRLRQLPQVCHGWSRIMLVIYSIYSLLFFPGWFKNISSRIATLTFIQCCLYFKSKMALSPLYVSASIHVKSHIFPFQISQFQLIPLFRRYINDGQIFVKHLIRFHAFCFINDFLK